MQNNLSDNKWNYFFQDYYIRTVKKRNKQLYITLCDNIRFKNIHKGKRCFVIGNGPSLKKQDLSLLKGEIVFTCNQISRSPDFKLLKTNYHFWADPAFFKPDENKPEDMEILSIMKNVVTEDNNPQCFFPLDAYDFVGRYDLRSQLKIAFFMPGLLLHEGFNMEIDFTKMLPCMNTVVQYSILLAIYMEFSEIYLLGCDCTGILTSINSRLEEDFIKEYAYQITDNEKQRMLNRNKVITMEQDLLGWSKIFKGYRILYDYCNKRNIKLINCTCGGVLDCLPREEYQSLVLKGKN